MLAKLAYTPPSCAGSMWMFSWRSRCWSIRDDDTRGVTAIDRLAARLTDALGGAGVLERPKGDSHGDLATNVAMRNAKAEGRPPRELAEEYVEKAIALDDVESAEIAGPGFLNLRLADPFFLA